MTVTVEWTQEDVDTLKAAIASGVLTVKYSGPPAREQTYQSTDAMKVLLAQIVAEANRATRPAYRLAAHRKGFDE